MVGFKGSFLSPTVLKLSEEFKKYLKLEIHKVSLRLNDTWD